MGERFNGATEKLVKDLPRGNGKVRVVLTWNSSV